MSTEKSKLIQKIDEVCRPYCTSKFCILKEIIRASHDDARFLVQLKAIEIFRWNLSRKHNEDISLDDALLAWAANGMAKDFADLYTEDIDVIQLYDMVEATAVADGRYSRE